ncbi:MAG: EAL domain-containing protein [Lachnospiraceae bacterium]|nr:EAL domain-containing protein [Lachnospiraceae bacterium]
MDTDKVAELKKKIEALESQLKVMEKNGGLYDNQDRGLWEYDIKGKRLIQSRKLEGKWSNDNLTVENYREQILEWNLVHPEDIHVFEEFCDSLDRGKAHIMYEIRMLRDNGKFAWLRQEGNTVYDGNGEPVKVIGKVSDVTREKTDRELLEREVTKDALTGLYNLEVAQKMIEKRLMDPEDSEPTSTSALMLIDLDDFSRINEAYGHVYGDTVLEMAANIIYTNFKAKDIVCRVFGDEFMVYCPRIGGEDKLGKHINKMLLRFQEFMDERDGQRCSISLGAALFPRDGGNFDELYRSADIALYHAKQSGKNQYVLYQKGVDYGTTIGETYRKINDRNRNMLALDQQFVNINKDLFDFSFMTISNEKDFYQAIHKIFEEVCLYFSLDRSTLMEWDNVNRKIRVTSRWVRKDDGDDLEKMEQTASVNWYVMEKYYQEMEYNILTGGKDEKEDYGKDIFAMNKVPVSAIQFPIMDNGKMAGVLTFESWEEKEWKKVEIATLSSITRMISSYLLQRQTKEELETEYLVGKKAMDVQNLIYYMVGEQDYRIRYMSHYARECYPNARYGQICYEAFMGRSTPCPSCPIADCQSGKEQNIIETYDGEEDSWYTLTASVMDRTPGDRLFLLCKSNVTAFMERVKGEDQLTGAMSYEKFKLEAVRAIKRDKGCYTLVFLGIQDFSRINDEYGYEIGDQVLRRFAEEIKEGLQEDELLCRIKGDDFAILMKKRTMERLYQRVGELSDSLTGMFRKRFPNISINCFSGIYYISDEEEYISRCLDRAMKARKVALKNIYETNGVYVYSKEFEDQEKEREETNRTMKTSLQKGYFRVYFQPKVDIVTGEIIGAEALVRLVDKDNNLISPGRFIPLAEENGLIVEIDKFVYEETFRLIKKWQDAGKKVPLISVNVSRLHLLNDELPSYMKGLSDKYGLKPEQIELEITESVFFEDTERLIDMIKQMKEIGYITSMDDFGAGFSTLSLMKSLPVDVIKLDGGFFLKNQLDEKSRAVISAMMQLAENLGFAVVSEGVETMEQVDFIRQQGSRCVQGFYFYKPMPAEEFEKLLKPSA